jgi:hypothetical protein
LREQIATRHGRGDLRDVPHLVREVRTHGVDGVGEILPRPRDAWHDGLHSQSALGADLARDARHLRRERPELLDHRVDGFLQLQDLAAHVHGDLLRQVAVGHGDRHSAMLRT